MQIATTEPRGWSPGAVAPSSSTRSPGLVEAALDAWRGVPERSEGVPLTSVQVDHLAPFLAEHSFQEVEAVRNDLERVRVHIGGPAHKAGNVATTFGPHIYVSDAKYATRMLSWSGRRWLTHELMHTMQWRASAGPDATDAQRDRRFLNEYLGSYVASDGSIAKGGVGAALQELVRRHRAGEPAGKLADLFHDHHPMEHRAEQVARQFAP